MCIRDRNRTANIALVEYPNGQSAYIIHPEGLTEGQMVVSGYSAPLQSGNTLPLKAIPLGIEIHNIEIEPSRGGKLVKAAGTAARLVAKEGSYATIRLPSG